MEAMPTPRPTKNLPIMRIVGFGAAAMTTEPTTNNKSAMRIDFFLPKRSLIHPPTVDHMAAPTSAILTIAPCFVQNIIFIKNISI